MSARRRIAAGAAGLVRPVPQRLRGEDAVEPDEERKAAMVSNLHVVSCGEQATRQVGSTGSRGQ